MMPQKMTGLENLPLKPVIALMAVAAMATAAMLCRPAKHPETALSPALKALEEGRGTLAIVSSVPNVSPSRFISASNNAVMMQNMAALMLPVSGTDSPQLKPLLLLFKCSVLLTPDFI